MDTKKILSDLRAELAGINQAIAALESLDSSATPRTYKKGKKQSADAPVKRRRKMSAAARKRISEAAKKRWAEIRKAKAAKA